MAEKLGVSVHKIILLIAATGLSLVLIGCSGTAENESLPIDNATAPSLETIPYEPLPEKVAIPFLIRDNELSIEEQARKEIIYVVEPGDSLALIAEAFGVTAEELQRLNGIADPTMLRANDELRIPIRPGTETERIAATLDDHEEAVASVPSGEEYIVMPGDTLITIAMQFNLDWFTLADHNRLSEFAANNLQVDDVLYIPLIEEESEDEIPPEPPG